MCCVTRLGKVATEALAIRITVLVLTLIGNSASRVNTILIEEQQRTEEGSSSRKTKLRDRYRCDYHILLMRFGADAREFEGWLGLLEDDPRYSKIPAPLG